MAFQDLYGRAGKHTADLMVVPDEDGNNRFALTMAAGRWG
jgi:hypothetical protein